MFTIRGSTLLQPQPVYIHLSFFFDKGVDCNLIRLIIKSLMVSEKWSVSTHKV